MERFAKVRIALLTVAISALLASAALALPPTNAEVVFVRKVCSTFYAPTYCVQTMADINTWLPTRSPAHKPVLVDVGPGDWDFFSCSSQDNVTVRGAGRDTTRIVRNNVGGGAMNITNCANLTVENLTAHGSFVGVQWSQGGSSTWSNTDIFAGGTEFAAGTAFSIGWYDANPTGAPLHYFFGSRARALGTAVFNYGFFARGDAEHWFFGGEILATSETDQDTSQTAVLVGGTGDFRVFGTAIRSTVGAAVTSTIIAPLPPWTGGMHGVWVQDNGVFHAHGAIVSVSAGDSSDVNEVTGLQVLGTTAHAHTPDTAFFVSTGPDGSANRLLGNADDLQSPFLWQQGTEPPHAQHDNPGSAFLQSVRGADLFVETDCTSTDCSSVGTVPRLLISRPECDANGPWWDVQANACR